ncbi:MAG TPA: TIGR02444 family protein [Azospirillaceae bacterium]|nr:TIGR02444 family protein [Azospirillaceae bacterium]
MSGTLSLWDFSLATYAKPGVPEACLDLQDRHGADVNLLLWAAWLGSLGHVLTESELDAGREAVSAWHGEVVMPLRAVRRRLKEGPPPAPSPATEALRNRVKAAELEAERLEQSILADVVRDVRRDASSDAAILANLQLAVPEAPAVTRQLHKAISAGA